jgi:nucleoside transporter
MKTVLYIQLAAMMFLQFAIWGAWMPVLATRLLGPLKMSGKQVGWIYGALFLASIVTPMIGGQITDRWVATQWFLAAAHGIGGILMLVAARQTKFVPMLVVMGAYSLFFAPTIPLTNALMFSHLTEPENQALLVLVWGPIGWTLVGWLLTGWRRWSKTTNDGRDCQILAGIISLLMAGACLLLPHTPPAGSTQGAFPFLDALGLLKDTDFLVFILISIVMSALLQFYFMGTAPFLETIGIKQKNVPAAMSVAQIAQIAILFVLGWFLEKLGYKGALAVGMGLWLAMYLIYAIMKPRWLVVASMAFHGLAYAFFFNVGWIYVNQVADPAISNSAQALLTVATFGLGMFVGTQFTGRLMDRFHDDSGFRWRPIYSIPCTLIVLSILALLFCFKGAA